MTAFAHGPEITKRTDGNWGVYCQACSAEAEHYTYPCLLGVDPATYPPQSLTDAADADRLRKLIGQAISALTTSQATHYERWTAALQILSGAKR